MSSQTLHLTTASLLRTSILASLLAGVIIVLFILPAEYNLDPTGLGEKMGLTALAQETQNSAVSSTSDTDSGTQQSSGQQLIPLSLAAGEDREFKVLMQQYDKLNYEWVAYGAPVYVDLHGEPAGDTTGYFESYTVATADNMKGSFTAPFAGTHGWYFNNTSSSPIEIRLALRGQYQLPATH